MAHKRDNCEALLCSDLLSGSKLNLRKILHYTCSICLKTFSFDEELAFHWHLHGHIVNSVSSNDEHAEAYIKNEESAEKKFIPSKLQILNCLVCAKTFGHNEVLPLRLHLWSHTEGYPNVNSNYVPSTVNKDSLNKRRNPFKNYPLNCWGCNKTFTHLDELARHLRIHIDSCPIECAICGRIFDSQEGLERHVLIHVKGKAGPYSYSKSSKYGNSDGNFESSLKVKAKYGLKTEHPGKSSKKDNSGGNFENPVKVKTEYAPKPEPSGKSSRNGNSDGNLENPLKVKVEYVPMAEPYGNSEGHLENPLKVKAEYIPKPEPYGNSEWHLENPLKVKAEYVPKPEPYGNSEGHLENPLKVKAEYVPKPEPSGKSNRNCNSDGNLEDLLKVNAEFVPKPEPTEKSSRNGNLDENLKNPLKVKVE